MNLQTDLTEAPPLVIKLEVLGRPAPKGSGRAILVKGRAMHVPSGSNANRDALRSWDVAVRCAAQEAVNGAGAPPFVNTALSLHIVFRLARPAGHYGQKGLKPSAPVYPTKKPDSSKLARATEDSLTGIIWDDDARIVRSLVEKVYASPGNEGATITIEAML